MGNKEIEKLKVHLLVTIIDYIPKSVVTKTIIKKPTGNICMVAMDAGEVLGKKISPFDIFIQVIEGIAEIEIDSIINILQTGEAIIIPAHTSINYRANERVKLISTIIKSGYEEIVF
jgi:quercetin dioxygenase-like cupin family protein